ncbi:hypothetical protein [Aquimarina sp. 2201CG5-10]|uniref:hypothetical protein n=1 Tax=Aquimarina callyspongiae TaxID=3098150 RepID=UPI002AB5BB56|nr:hypothetical protein [Aquimarina sp. 2201CG5-10]MDY8138452.1 hypothetical protein [Aquimarina sp. 2201CG5-10]
MIKKLVLIILCIYGIQVNAQKTLPQGSTWYSYGVSDPSKALEITITHQDEIYMKVTRKLIATSTNSENPKKKKKKKGSFFKNLKNAVTEKPRSNNSSNKTKTSPLEGTFNYKVVSDNTDDGIYMDSYKYDEAVYGFVYPIGDGLYKEVVFTKDPSVHNFLKDENPATASVYIMGTDKEAVKAKAASLNADEELKKFYTPDYSTGRLKNPAVSFHSYNGRNFDIDPENGTIDLLQSTVYYLPSKTIEGRNIQYNWSAFNLKLFKDGKLVHKVIGQKGHRNGRWLEKVKNTFDMYGSFERVTPGKYQLTYSIYDNDPFFTIDFEVYTHANPDINHEIGTVYTMKGPWDENLSIDLRPDDQGNPTQFKTEFPLFRLLPLGNEKNQIQQLQSRLYKNGKLIGLTDSEEHPDGSATVKQALERRGSSIDLLYRKDKYQDSNRTEFHLISNSTKPSSWDWIRSLKDGNYKIEYLVNQKSFAEVTFTVKGNKIQLQGNQVKEGTDPKKYIMDESLILVPINYK